MRAESQFQMRPNPSLNADVPYTGLRPRSGPPVNLVSLGVEGRRGTLTIQGTKWASHEGR
jgi:hypothetical protein